VISDQRSVVSDQQFSPHSASRRVILSERGPKRFLQLGGGESKDLLLAFGMKEASHYQEA
jgi:hypothetical protein